MFEQVANLVSRNTIGVGVLHTKVADLESATLVADVWGQCIAQAWLSEEDIQAWVSEAMRMGYPVRDAWLIAKRAVNRSRQLSGASQALFH
jgi:hypothetical protein